MGWGWRLSTKGGNGKNKNRWGKAAFCKQTSLVGTEDLYEDNKREGKSKIR